MKDDEKAKDKDELGKSTVKKDEKKLSSAVSNKKIRELAEAYMRKKGMTMLHPKLTFDVSPERGAKIAKAYEEMKHEPENPKVKKAYDALIRETLDQWNEIRKTGLKVTKIAPDMENPYPGGSKDVLKDISENNHLFYFPTEQGYGSTEVSNHPLLQKVKVDGEEVPANDVFRIVHDYFGHAKEGHSFGPQGEENAWMTHKQMYSPEAQKALTAETRGQNSWVNFGPLGEQNRKDPSKTTYAEQKAGLLPDWAVDEEPTTGREKMADGGRVMMQDGGDPAEAFVAPDTTPMPEATPMPAPTPEPVTPSVTQMPELGQPAAPEEKPLATTITREYAPLWDVSGPQPKLVQMPHDRVNESIQSGKYSFDKLAQIPVIAPDGEIGTMPADKFYESVQNKEGFTYATPKQVTEYEYGGAGQQAIAFAEGLARGVAGPLATGAEKLLGVSSEDILAREEANPKTALAGEALGFAAPLVLTGGALAAEKLGAEALGAGLKGAAQVAAKAPLPLAAEAVGKLVPQGAKFITRVPLNFARGALEGAVFGASDQLSDAMLNNPDQTIQSALTAVGMSGLFGGALGAGFGALGEGFGAAKKLLTRGEAEAPVLAETPFYTTMDELERLGAQPAQRTKFSEAPEGAPLPPEMPTVKAPETEAPVKEELPSTADPEEIALKELKDSTTGQKPPTPEGEGLYSPEEGGFWVKPEDVANYEAGHIPTILQYHSEELARKLFPDVPKSKMRGHLKKFFQKVGLQAKDEARQIEKAILELTDNKVALNEIPLPFVVDGNTPVGKMVHLFTDNALNLPAIGNTKLPRTYLTIKEGIDQALFKLLGEHAGKSEVELGQVYKNSIVNSALAKKAQFKEPYKDIDDLFKSLRLEEVESKNLISKLNNLKSGLGPLEKSKVDAIDSVISQLESGVITNMLGIRRTLQSIGKRGYQAFRSNDNLGQEGFQEAWKVLKDFEKSIGEGLPTDPRVVSSLTPEALTELVQKWPKKIEADKNYAKYVEELRFLCEQTGAPRRVLNQASDMFEHLATISADDLYKSLALKKMNYNEMMKFSREFPELADLIRSTEKQRILNEVSKMSSLNEKSAELNRLKKMTKEQKAFVFNSKEDEKLLENLLLVTKHGQWHKNFSNTSAAETINRLVMAGPLSAGLQVKAAAGYRLGERAMRDALNIARGYSTATGKTTKKQNAPIKGQTYNPKKYATGGMVEADTPEPQYNSQQAFVQAVNQPPKMQEAHKLAQAIIKGDKMVTNSVKSIFDPKSTYKIVQANPKNVEKLKTFVDKAHNDPAGIMSIGSDIMPEFNAPMTQAVSSAVGYIKSLQPPPPKDLPFDTGVKAPPSAHQDIYNHVLKVTEQPLSILHKVKQGTVIPEEVGAVKTIYPALYQKLQNQITEHLIESKTKGGSIPYKTKIGLSAFLGSPIDTTFTPESIQAAQPMQQNQPPQGAQTGVQPKRSTSGLDKMATMAQTPGQARVAERSQGK